MTVAKSLAISWDFMGVLSGVIALRSDAVMSGEIVRSVPPAEAKLLTGPQVTFGRVFGDATVGVEPVETGGGCWRSPPPLLLRVVSLVHSRFMIWLIGHGVVSSAAGTRELSLP